MKRPGPPMPVSAALAMLSVLLMLSACGDEARREPVGVKDLATVPRPQQTLSSNEERFLTWAQFQQAVAGAIDDYRWPPNYRTTATLVLGTDKPGRDRSSDRFERGLEYTALDLYNRCAWEFAWLDARKAGDLQGEAEALRVITDVLPNNPGMADSPDVRQFVIQIGQNATMGDPTLLQTDVRNNCVTVRYVTTSPTPGATR